MTESYKNTAQLIGSKLKEFGKRIPETMQGFNQMGKATHADGAHAAKAAWPFMRRPASGLA